jgi:anti-sigma B factor antagonist
MTAQPHGPCLTTEVVGDATVARFRGDALCLDETNSPSAGEALTSLADRVGAGKIVLSLGNVTYMSSAGLGVLIALHKKLHTAGGALVLRDLRPAVRELITVTRLDNLLTIDGQAR